MIDRKKACNILASTSVGNGLPMVLSGLLLQGCCQVLEMTGSSIRISWNLKDSILIILSNSQVPLCIYQKSTGSMEPVELVLMTALHWMQTFVYLAVFVRSQPPCIDLQLKGSSVCNQYGFSDTACSEGFLLCVAPLG